jgi:putative DNA primase/helicase
VRVERLDLAGIRHDRDQLWAEAAEAEANGEPLGIGSELWGVAAIEQSARLNHDAWEDVIRTKLATAMAKVREKSNRDGQIALMPDEEGKLEWRVSSTWILTGLLGIPQDRIYKTMPGRVADVMRTLGWSKPTKVIRVGKVEAGCRGYVLKEPGTALVIAEPLATIKLVPLPRRRI